MGDLQQKARQAERFGRAAWKEEGIRMEPKKFSTKQLVEMALLTAIIILLAFTPIGYIRMPGLEITLIVVPVTVGAVTLGPAAGAVLGAVFGITSFIQCFGMSGFGAALLGINPVFTCVVCIVPRLLMGWLTGCIYQGLKKAKKLRGASVALANLAGPILNTVLFMGTLVALFYQTEYIQGVAQSHGATNALMFEAELVGVNGIVEAAACFVAGSAISKALIAALKLG